MKQIYHKKNELFEVEFYQDNFDFTNARDLYVQGGIATLIELSAIVEDCNIYIPFLQKTKYYTLSAISFVLSENKNTLYTISETDKFTDGTFYNSILENIKTITPNLSKYIPEDNAVLFLSEEDKSKFSVNKFSQNVFNRTPLVSQYFIDRGDFPRNLINGYFNDNNSTYTINGENKGVHPIYRKLTIFLPHGTQSELEKANEVAKELKEKYGVNEVNLCVLHWFGSEYQKNSFEIEYFCQDFGTLKNINKTITTNSTGILKPEDSKERLQVIDCKEIFEEYLKESN